METNIVYQEDCIEGMKKIPSNSIDLVLTDPPYGIGIDEWDKPIDLEKYNNEWISICCDKLKENGVICIFGNCPLIFGVYSILKNKGFYFINHLIWQKKKGKNYLFIPQRNKNKKPSSGGRQYKNYISKGQEIPHPLYTSVWDDIREVDNSGKSDIKYKHPTQKPIEIIKRLLFSLSDENQLVLDCFGGSGTIAIACIETNRQYILFENNPQYFKIINDRIKSAKSQTLLTQPSAEGSLIGIKRKPCEVSQIPNGTSLNSDIQRLHSNLNFHSQC